MNKLYITELTPALKKYCASFSCRNKYIDNFLKGSDSLDQDVCKTFILMLTSNDKKIIVGYYSLAADCVFGESEVREGKEYKSGAIRILMFAIDERFQHKKNQD